MHAPGDEVRNARLSLLNAEAMQMRPNEMLSHVELGVCHEALTEPQQARDRYRQALAMQTGPEVPDESVRSLDGLARCEEALGDIAAALAALKQLRLAEKRRSDEAARQAITQRELRIELARLTVSATRC